MIEIEEVKTKKQQKEFLDFPLTLYKGCPYFVPPLYADEKKIFSKKFVYIDTCLCSYFLAKDNGKVVGRISGIIQKASNEKHNEKRVRFTRFDAIDSIEVASALFNAVENWGKNLGMDTICGPLGFSDLEREGLLIEGFDQLSTFEEQYNFPYYEKLIEKQGFATEVTWNERKLFKPKEVDEKLERVSHMMLERYNLHFAHCKNTRQFLNKYADKFFEILDDTYEDIYGTVPFTDRMKQNMLSNFKLIVDQKHISVIVDEHDNVVCFGICFPSIAKAVQKSNGHLTLPAICRLLKAIKKPKVIDLGLIGVRKEYALKGISSAVTAEVMKMLCEDGVEYAETNLNLEDNVNIQNQWRRFDSVIHKRRRAYVKSLKDEN